MKKNSFKYSVFGKIFALISSIIVFFGIIAIFVVYYASFNSIISSEKDHLLASNSLYAKIIDQRFKDAEKVVKEITTRGEIVDHFMFEHDHASHIQGAPITLYLEHYNVGEEFDAIYLMDRNGLVVSSTEPTFLNQNYAFREYFKKIKEGEPIYLDSYIGVTSNKLGYYISAPVLDKNNKVVAVAVCKMKLDTVHNNISEVADTNDYEAISMFVDKYGVILFSDDNERVYNSLSRLPDTLLTNFSDNKRFNNINIEHLEYDEPMRMIDDKFYGSKIIDIYDERDSEREILTISSIGNFPFYLISEIKTEYFSKNSIQIALVLALSVLVAVLSAVFFIYVVVRKILKPLNNFKEVTESIASGNYNVSVPVNTRDEFGALADSVNKMSESIKDYSENLEKKITEKTQKLEKINNAMVGRELKMVELKKAINRMEKSKE